MTPSCLASFAGAAALVLLAACGRQPEPPAAILVPVTQAVPRETLVAPGPDQTLAQAATAEPDAVAAPPRKRGGGAFGIGIRPTGSSASGITP
jgi:hypothetical protein